MLEERLAKLLARKLSGEATAIELEELDIWLQDNPADQYFADILFTYWNSYPDITTTVNTDADQHFAHILEMAEEPDDGPKLLPITEAENNPPGLLRRIRRIAIAASIAGIILLATWMINRNTKNKSDYAAAETPKSEVLLARRGVRPKIALPDGTRVSLNSDSKLTYDETFNDEIREVTLEGEAYFDVMKDPKRPFVVHTSGIDIRVLGTAFNVKSYPQDPIIETTLIHGSIEVINKRKPKFTTIYVKPHEKLLINKTNNVFEKSTSADVVTKANTPLPLDYDVRLLAKNIPDTSLIETSWVYDKLSFDEEKTFREEAVKMERWFNVRIRFKSEKVANYNLHGSFTTDESIDEVLESLRVIAPFHYKIKNNEVEISK